MKKKSILTFAGVLFGMIAISVPAVAQTSATKIPADTDRFRRWADSLFVDAKTLPFSFTYDGQPSSEIMSRSKYERRVSKPDKRRLQTDHVYRWPSGVEICCRQVDYFSRFPVTEWTLYIRNNGKRRSGIFENIQALDLRYEVAEKEPVFLNFCGGGISAQWDFQAQRQSLGNKQVREFGSSSSGFPTADYLPFFNLERADSGIITAVGWPAQWKTTFDRSRPGEIAIRTGQKKTRLYLEPSDEIRTPLVVVMGWKGDRQQAQNQWRQWMLACNLPRPGGKLPSPMLEAASSPFFAEMFHATDRDQMTFIDRYLEEDVRLDYWWMDAGWYPNKGGTWQDLLGTWYPDPKRYPNGLRAISDHAHAKGVKTLLWFEPERVTAGSWIYENHPEWTLGEGHTRFFNYGNPEALNWMIGRIDSLLNSEAIDLYRQDFAIQSVLYWGEEDRKHPDRQGWTEIRHVMGYLTLLDELRERHPQMLIDICAAGGKRLELENLRRAVPLWRSDHAFEPIGVQGQTYGLSMWIPFSGAGVNRITTYDFRSNMAPSMVLNLDARVREADYPLLRVLLSQWRELADDFSGDYYPLTSYSLQPDVWIGWEFFRPATGTGFIQMFRRPGALYDSGVCYPKGLEPQAKYRITDVDTGEQIERTGERWMKEGLRVSFTETPQAKLFRIEIRS